MVSLHLSDQSDNPHLFYGNLRDRTIPLLEWSVRHSRIGSKSAEKYLTDLQVQFGSCPYLLADFLYVHISKKSPRYKYMLDQYGLFTFRLKWSKIVTSI